MELEIKAYEDPMLRGLIKSSEIMIKNLFLLACLQKKRDL